MRKVERLKKEALKTCQANGHRMSRFQTIFLDSWIVSKCFTCNSTLHIKLNLDQGEQEISGKAIDFYCVTSYCTNIKGGDNSE